ncbi:hypothetical protein CN193_22010 [Sinorhizobium meliloti]|nr:hypothetical protein CN193_22010 [Sinorhizobium meliloti]
MRSESERVRSTSGSNAPVRSCQPEVRSRAAPDGARGLQNFGSPPATAVESRGAKVRLWRQFQTLASSAHVSDFRVAPPSSGRSAVDPEETLLSSRLNDRFAPKSVVQTASRIP